MKRCNRNRKKRRVSRSEGNWKLADCNWKPAESSWKPAVNSLKPPEEVRRRVPAEAPAHRQFEVGPTSSPIHVDGKLDDAGWQSATVVDLPYEWFPGDNTKPPVATEALVTFDKENLYVGFRAHDPNPKAIRSQLMDRDLVATFVQDDHVGFTVDPFNDERQGFQFRVNPRGVQADASFSEIDGVEDFSWDAIWASAGRITEQRKRAAAGLKSRSLKVTIASARPLMAVSSRTFAVANVFRLFCSDFYC